MKKLIKKFYFLSLAISCSIGCLEAAEKIELKSNQSVEIEVNDSDLGIDITVFDGRVQVLIRGTVDGKEVKKLISETGTGLRESTFSKVDDKIVEVIDSNGDGHADSEESDVKSSDVESAPIKQAKPRGKKSKWQKGSNN